MEKQYDYRVIKVTRNIATLSLTSIEYLNLSEKELEEFWKKNQGISAGCSDIISGRECYCQFSFTDKEIITIIQIKI